MPGKHTIGIGITGGIAAYKVTDLVSRLTKEGNDVHVVMTQNATKIIPPLPLRTLSGNPVLTDTFEETSRWKVQHIGFAEAIDILVIVPATANIIAKMAHGIADDLLSTEVLATKAPILVCPAMNTNMFENPVTQENIEILRRRGMYILEPAEGELACGVKGKGRLPEIETVYQSVMEILAPVQDLAGKTVLITAGATCEDIDPVRFITNRSTGKMGYALAEQALRRGARVILVTGAGLSEPGGATVVPVRSALEMYEASMRYFPESDIVIGAAAVADYRPQAYSDQKVKKSDDDLVIRLVRNPDILKEMGQQKGNRILIGFAAETQDLIQNGKAKLASKNLDLLIANDVTEDGAGFGADTNIVTLLSPGGETKQYQKMPKVEVAKIILDATAALVI
ncbi:MAG: bifunctional phosphopantothenoylcysteine decarboxylase/phosphopantothenate--cysteine ligase CoaBC [Solirubrobacterales bacterium]